MGRAPLGLWVRGPLRLDQLPAPVAVVGSRSATTYGDRRRRRARRRPGPGRLHRGLRGRVRHRPGRPPRCARRRRSDRRRAGLRCRPGLPRRPPGAARPPGRARRVVSELAPGLRADPAAVPGPQPAHRRAVPRHRRGRGGGAQRRAQHRELDEPAQPAADGRARAGHQRPVRGRPPADPLAAPRRWSPAASDVLELVGAMGEHLPERARGPTAARDRLTAAQQQVLEAVPVTRPAPVRLDRPHRRARARRGPVRPDAAGAARPGRAAPDGLAARRRRGSGVRGADVLTLDR